MKQAINVGLVRGLPRPIITQRVHVGIWYMLAPSSRYTGTPLGPQYIPYTYMDPLGWE